ncbi:MAG TPA: shikimate kinase [Lacipirellulaceae bacterium]|nr:shikimate kinase [Lacipirellulaceae bacterium]
MTEFASAAPIFLIGYRGTGKSTVARHLAERLGYDSVDADAEIERRAGKSIAAIFADNGEAAFRDLESQLVAELSGLRRSVIALGGGAVLRESNRIAIRDAGPVVWLTAPVDVIVARLAADPATAGRRPNLTKTGGRDEIETLLTERTPIYGQCATLVVNTDGKTCAQVADEIAANL